MVISHVCQAATPVPDQCRGPFDANECGQHAFHLPALSLCVTWYTTPPNTHSISPNCFVRLLVAIGTLVAIAALKLYNLRSIGPWGIV